MDPSPLNVTPSGTKTQWAKPQDWEKYRNTITALFMCHSLPVVMRVMREEHHFHATPKMFQSQIYQKWGLRKTKPGEAKKEAKERKRRRQDSEEVESVSSDARSREAAATDNNASTASGSIESTSPAAAAHRQANVESRPVEPAQNEVGTAAMGIVNAVPASAQRQTGRSNYIVPELQGAVPKGWRDFLNQSKIPASLLPPAIGTQDMSSSFVTEFSANDDPNQSPKDMASPRTQSLRSATKSSRASPKLPEFEFELSPSNGAKRARYMDGITQPMGTIRVLESTPMELLPERSMFYARHFISSTYATGVWSLASGDMVRYELESAKLEHWYNDFNHGFDCLRDKKVKKAFRIMKRCFANTKGVIEPQDPRVVIYMCQQTIRCMFYDTLGRNLAQTLLKYIAGLCQVIFGAHHPLFVVFSQLSRLGSFEFAQLIRPFMDCYFDHLEPFLEHSTNAFGHITEMRGLTISLMEATGMMGIYEAKPVLDRLIMHAQKKNLPTLHLKVELASILSRNRFFNEALSLLRNIRESEEGKDSPYERVYAGIILVMTFQKMKDLDGAIEANLELVEELSRPPSTYPGYPDKMTVNWVQHMESRESSLLLVLGKLERNLRDAGRDEEADRVQKRLDGEVTQEFGVEVDQDPEASVNAMV